VGLAHLIISHLLSHRPPADPLTPCRRRPMTPEEFEAKLKSLSPEEFKRFQSDIGGGEGRTVGQYVDDFVRRPGALESLYCHYFKMQTEQDKVNAATISGAGSAKVSADAAVDSAASAKVAADAAVESAKQAKRSADLSFWALLVAAASAVIALIAL